MVIRHEQPPEEPHISLQVEWAEAHNGISNDVFAERYFQEVENKMPLLAEGQELAGNMYDVNGEKHIVVPDEILALLPHAEKPAWRHMIFNKNTGKAAIVVSVAGLVAGAALLRQRRKS